MKQKDDAEDTEAIESGLRGGYTPDPAQDVRFDYATFETTMGFQRPTATEPARGASDVQKRWTIDDQSIPKDDAVYDIRQLGKYQVVTIRGQINESFPGRTIGGSLHGPTLFDLTEVDRVTSFGVRAWLEMMEVARLPFAAFVRASPAIVNQITMMRNFCGSARIHSLLAPYACPRCGSGFGVAFDAIDDRALLRGRTPPKVVCPECRGAADMDEDPWVYFDLDDHLLDSVEPELERVLTHLGDAPRRPPVEKSIAGDLTRVRLNGPITATTRLQRAFGGLEGKIILDLRGVTELDGGGIDNLVQFLARLPEEVHRLNIEGATPALVAHLLRLQIPRAYVNSVVTTVRSLARPLRRRVVVDLKVHRAMLRDRQIPDFDLPWRGDPMELDDHDLVVEALRLLQTSGTTPPPLPRAAPLEPAPVRAPPPVVSAPPAPSRRRRWAPWALLGGALVLFLSTLTGAAVVLYLLRPAAAVPAVGWSTGGDLPPPWAEIDVGESNGTILVVGRGEASDAELALSAARDQALDTLLLVLARELRVPFDDDALPAEGAEREAAFQQWRTASAALSLTRLQEAARRAEHGYEVVAQYAASRADLDALGGAHSQQGTFRGLSVAPRPPWHPPALRLVRRESYIRNVEPGDVLRTVGATPVTTVADFERVAEAAYRALQEGESLEFVFDRGGQPISTSIFKPKTRPDPEPGASNRPTLFRRD